MVMSVTKYKQRQLFHCHYHDTTIVLKNTPIMEMCIVVD